MSTNVYGSMIYFFPCSPLWKLSMASVLVSTFMATKSPKMWRASQGTGQALAREKKKSRKNETDKTRKNVQFLREKKTSLLLYFCFQFTLLKTVFPKKSLIWFTKEKKLFLEVFLVGLMGKIDIFFEKLPSNNGFDLGHNLFCLLAS